ncbi:uncharacterized protein LOC111919791 isoform X2 [Lactuca sativa]|uniref:uncharacterized protein LOC111919791 isoform X2 n=1 Tax=Lactuca sativa TaxID=4236 RepID=UPI001C68799B|nr:uncharacterized protein LOC111919791 isoform X2 [Lactuca sativa]
MTESSSSSSPQDNPFSMNTLLHPMTIKLSSSNYLLCRNHLLLPIFTYQKLLRHLDGSFPAPSTTVTVEEKSLPNPDYQVWTEADQRAIILLQSSLKKLQPKFLVSPRLATSGSLLKLLIVTHLLSAFILCVNPFDNSQKGRGRSFNYRGLNSRGKGRGQGRRPPHCQLCRYNGHYASSCPQLHTYATQAPSSDENLAKAFHAQCHVTKNTPDWHVDSGATYHMTPTCDSLNHSTSYLGSENQKSSR